MGLTLKDGGIFAQGEGQAISGVKPISKDFPIVIYSPEILTLHSNSEEIKFGATSNIASLTVIESSLTKDDIEYLKSQLAWKNFYNTLGTEDWVNFIFIIFSLVILLPLSVIGLIFTYKQKKRFNSFPGLANREKSNYKEASRMLRQVKERSKK